ncbi:MAG: WD40 repeat domain-containing protein [Cyanobacteriota bacterium]|nr:WD40 repeat domain-containing protein [Cyanobacteriota bacterium]
MQAQKIAKKGYASLAVSVATAAITATALIWGNHSSRTRYPATDFSKPILGEKTQASKTLLGHNSWIYTVAIAPDGETVASGSYDGSIKIWHLSAGGLIRTLDAHSDAIASLAISSDGETLVSGSWDDCIKIWNLPSATLTRTINLRADDVKAVAIAPDGKTVAAGTYSGVIKLWNSKTGTQTGEFKHSGPVTSVAIGPQGKYLASGSRNGTVKIWEIETGWELTLEGHKKAVWAIAFSPDGQTLASGGGDRAVKLWQVETGEKISTFKEHSKAVYSVAFSPDGQTLASGSYDRQIHVWQPNTKKLLESFVGHGKAVWSVGFTPDGESVVSGSADRTVKVWSVSAVSGDVGLKIMEPALDRKRERTLDSQKRKKETESYPLGQLKENIETDILAETKAVEISLLGQLQELNQQLYDRLDLNWRDTPEWYYDLVYRVTVNEDGAIVSYEPANQPARDYLDRTPLPQLVDTAEVEEKPFAFFRVVMTPTGVLEVSPWQGWE